MLDPEETAEQHATVHRLKPNIPQGAECLNCEYFLGDGTNIGDCLNTRSAAFQRRADELCILYVKGS